MPKVIKGASGPFSSAPPSASGPSARTSAATINSSRPGPVQKKAPGIIQHEVVGAKQEGRRIVEDAEQQAARILEEAQQHAEELRQKGYDDGYQEGLGQYTEQTTRALMEVEKLKAEIEPQYVALVRACVEKILGQEMRLNPDAVIGLVRNTLRDATQQREIIVRIHPDDAEHLRKNQRRLLDVLARASQIEVRDDPLVTRGGCIVLTELGTIDASLDRQLAALETALSDEAAGAAAIEDSDGEYDEEEES